MEEKEKKKINWKSYIIAGLIALAIGALVFCLYFFLNGRKVIDGCNASILAAVSLIGIGALMIVSKLGAFDTFSYGFIQLGHAMFGRQPKKYKDMIEYKQVKYEERKEKDNYFYSFIAVGMLFIIATIILEIIYHVQLGQ